MFFEQYSHEPYIAVVRFWRHFAGKLSPQQEIELPDRIKKGHAALEVMERHLETRPFFVGERYGLADIALYGYTHVAHEGDFDLARYPHIRTWLARVAAQPGQHQLAGGGPCRGRDAAVQHLPAVETAGQDVGNVIGVAGEGDT